jgi:hypothetical protein
MTLRVLIYLDTSLNALQIVSGASVGYGSASPIPYPDLPSGGIPSAYVQLYGGQTAIVTATHIVDARDYLGGSSGGSGSGNDFPTRNVVVSQYAGIGSSDNVVMGYNAGLGMGGSGSKNVVIGSYAGSDNGDDTLNVLVGYLAGGGDSAAGASYNTFVGAQAGEASDGDYNVFLGYNAGKGSAGDYRLYIDISNTSTPLIYGEFDDDNLGINSVDMAGGVGVVSIGNVDTAPTGTPVGGGVLYVDSGALKWKGSSGTVTTIATA